LRKNSVPAAVQTGLLASLNLVETTALRTATATSAGIDVAGARQQQELFETSVPAAAYAIAKSISDLAT
jgi:hypothetical protein